MPGTVVGLSELPAALREKLQWLKEQHARGAFQPYSGGSRFEDGSLWFTNGYEVELSVIDHVAQGAPGLAIFVAGAAAFYAYYLFDVGADSRWIGAGAAAALALVAVAALWWRGWRAQRAAAEMDLGTLLLDRWIVIVSRGRFVPIARSVVLGRGIAHIGTENRRDVCSIRHRVPAGERLQHLTGFAHDDEALAELDRWIASR